MAATNINNLDALDSVTNIEAADETLMKEGIRQLLHHTDDIRFCLDLFIGQMAAEGFLDVNCGDIRATVASPTAKVDFIWTDAAKTRCQGYLYISSAWVKVTEIVIDGSLTYAVTP